MMKKHNAGYLNSKPFIYLWLFCLYSLITNKYVQATFSDNPLTPEQKKRKKKKYFMWSLMFYLLFTFSFYPPLPLIRRCFLHVLLLDPIRCVSCLDTMNTCKVQMSQSLWAISASSNFSTNVKGCLLAPVIVILADCVLMASTFLSLHLNN